MLFIPPPILSLLTAKTDIRLQGCSKEEVVCFAREIPSGCSRCGGFVRMICSHPLHPQNPLGMFLKMAPAPFSAILLSVLLMFCIRLTDAFASRHHSGIMNALELTKELIKIESISGNELAIANFLADYLDRIGITVELQEAEAGRPNLYAKRGEPQVVLSTHTDTVPPYVELREDDEYIYGRGACDTKGLMAAMLKAAEALIAENVSDFGVLLVVGEENGSVGAKVANHIENQSRYLINGEPTESKLALGSKGALRAIVKAQGRAAHSAYPHMGESAIEKLLDILNDIRQAKLPSNDILGATTVNIGLMSGGVAANVIPPAAQAELMFRVVTDTGSLKSILEKTVNNRASIEYGFQCEPVFMEKIEGYETDVVSFTTDIPALTNWGKPLLFGPGSILDAHTANEKIAKRDILAAVDIYKAMVKQLQQQ